jgi:short-subunit dehydrogenase
MKNLQNKLAVITGAGSGLGRALAQTLAAEGCRLALVDKNPSGLKETLALLKGTTAKTWSVDITRKEAVDRLARDVEKKMGPADILINNAGIDSYGRVQDARLENMKKVVDVNLWGVIHMTQAFLPQLLKRPESALANICSTWGLKGFAGQAIYSASKFAVRGFTEGLRMEVEGGPLNVIAVFPGGMKTKIQHSAIKEYPLSKEEVRRTTEEMSAKLKSSPSHAAQVIVAGIKKGKSRILISLDAYVIDAVARLFPGGGDFLWDWLKNRNPFWKKIQDTGNKN